MSSHEYECPRCLNRYTDHEVEGAGVDPSCPVCGSVSVQLVDNCPDLLDVLRTGSGG